MKAIKNLLSLFAVLFAVMLSSCSNDDIPVNQSITFKINPSTVISDFAEFNPGELTSMPSSLLLRVRLLIYNDKGTLVASDTQTFKDYSHIMSSTQALEEGAYTVVTITDVKASDDELNWTLSNQESLNTLKLTKSKYIRYQYGLLGLETKKVNITSSTKTISIDVKPAGALAIVFYLNWNQYSNVTRYKLLTKKISDELTLNSDGTPLYSITSSSDFNYRISLADWDSNYEHAYRYVFLFPMQNVHFQFACETNDEKQYYLGESAIIDIEKGKEYLFAIDIATQETTWEESTSSASSSLRDATPMGKADFFEAKTIDQLQFDLEDCSVLKFNDSKQLQLN